jgi:hypothetical protein
LPVADQISRAVSTQLDFLALTDHRTYDQHWNPEYSAEQLLLIAGEEANGSPHAIVLGTVDEIIDGANPVGSAPFRHLQQSLWEAHAQDALWSIAHPDNGYMDGQRSANANASLTAPDLVEIWNIAGNPDAQLAFAEERWNRGFRLAAVGASDNHERELWEIAGPGHPTTWVFAAERSRRAVLDGLRAGRTTVSQNRDGPFLTLEAGARGDSFPIMMGEELRMRAGETLRLRANVRGGAGAKLYFYRSPGRSAEPIATFDVTLPDSSFIVMVPVSEGDQWYRAELRSSGGPSGRTADRALADQLRAATSPLFVSTSSLPAAQPEIPLPPLERRDDSAYEVFATAACDALSAPSARNFAGFADIAQSGATLHVVAEAHRDARSVIEYRRSAGSHHFDPATTLSTRTAVARTPRIAAAGTHVWVVWQDERDGAIYLRHSADAGRHWQREKRLSATRHSAVHPALELLDERTPVVTWAERSRGAYDIYALVVGVDREPVNLSATGKTIVPGAATDARAARHPASLFPDVAVTPRGAIAVVWQDNRFDPDPLWTGHTPAAGETESGGTDPDDYEILVSTRASKDAVWTEPAGISNDTKASDRHPSIVAAREGYVVAWDTRILKRAGVNTAIRASRSADGRTWSVAADVSNAPQAMALRPQLTVDADSVLAVWSDSRSLDWRWQLFASRLTSSTWTTPEQLTSNGNALWPAVARDRVVFTTDRRSAREQRRVRQEVFVLPIASPH